MPNQFAHAWPSEADDYLRANWQTHTALAIAKELGGQLGFVVSRSAVIARAHRMNLGRKLRLVRTEEPRELPEGAKLRRVRIQSGRRHSGHETQVVNYYAFEEKDPIPDTTCTLLELTATRCRWPIGEVGSKGFCYCGAEVQKPPYCAAHRERAHS